MTDMTTSTSYQLTTIAALPTTAGFGSALKAEEVPKPKKIDFADFLSCAVGEAGPVGHPLQFNGMPASYLGHKNDEFCGWCGRRYGAHYGECCATVPHSTTFVHTGLFKRMVGL